MQSVTWILYPRSPSKKNGKLKLLEGGSSFIIFHAFHFCVHDILRDCVGLALEFGASPKPQDVL